MKTQAEARFGQQMAAALREYVDSIKDAYESIGRSIEKLNEQREQWAEEDRARREAENAQ